MLLCLQARVVDELNRRIQYLETRLGQAQAYASLPPNMRPALMDITESHTGQAMDGGHQHPPSQSLQVSIAFYKKASHPSLQDKSVSLGIDRAYMGYHDRPVLD